MNVGWVFKCYWAGLTDASLSKAKGRESVVSVNFIMQGDQITSQEQPAKHERLPEHNEHSEAVDWKHHLLAPEIFTE